MSAALLFSHESCPENKGFHLHPPKRKRDIVWVCQHSAAFWRFCSCFGTRKVPRHTLQLIRDEAGPQALLHLLSWKGHVVCLCTPWGAGIGQQQRHLRHSRMYQGVSRKPAWASLLTVCQLSHCQLHTQGFSLLSLAPV